MTRAANRMIRTYRQRGFWLRCFLSGGFQLGLAFAILVGASAPAQTVCLGSPAECREAQVRLCKEEPAPANLLVACPVQLTGTLIDSTGAIVEFDNVKSDHQTIVQIRNAESGEIIFAVPLRKTGEFKFDLVPAGSYRLIAVWMHDGKFARLPLADQPTQMACKEEKECHIVATIRFHGTDNPIDLCPPR